MGSTEPSNGAAKSVKTRFLAIFMSALLVLSMFNLTAFATGEGNNNPISPTEEATEATASVQFNLENAFVAVNNQPIVASMAVEGIPTGQDLVFVATPITNAELTAVEAVSGIGTPVPLTRLNDDGTYSVPAGFVNSSLTINVKAAVANNGDDFSATDIATAQKHTIAPNDIIIRGIPEASESEKLTFGIDLLGNPIMDGSTALVPSGRNQVTSFTLFAAPMDGVVVLIPKTVASYTSLGNFTAINADISHGEISASQMASLGITYNGEPLAGDHYAVVIPRDPSVSGGFSSTFSLTYGFANGTTPDGATQAVSGYLFEGAAVESGSGILGSTITIKDGGAATRPVESYTLKATTDETISVSKSFHSVSEEGVGDQGNFPVIKERPYGDVTSGNDEYSITYKLNVATTGSGSEGRIFQQSVQVTDVISGFREDAPPTKVTVDGQEVTLSGTGSERTFTIDVPLSGGIVPHKEYTVVVTYSKNAYTNMYGQAPVLDNLQQVSNKAQVSNTPVVGDPVTSEFTAPVTNSFGYYQGNPTAVSLVVQKKWQVGSESDIYTERWQDVYGDANNPVMFKLVPQPGSPAEATDLASGVDAYGNVNFSSLVPGTTYELRETQSIGSGFESMSPVDVVVSALSSNGEATVTIGGTDYTGKSYEVTNTAKSVGNIEVRVKQQKPYESPAQYMTTPDGIKVELYDGNLKIDEAVTSQGIVMFYNLDASKSYTLVGEGIDDYVVSGPAASSVTVESSSTKSYELTYNSDKGSFKLGKNFKGPDGQEIAVNDFEAVFRMYDASDQPVGAPITITSKYGSGSAGTGVGIIQQAYPAGTYTLKETSLKINGNDAAGEYQLYAGSVTITAGDFGALPSESATSGTDAGIVTNASQYGQLKIKNYDFNGNGLGGFEYKITNNAIPDDPGTILTMSGGTSTLLLPDGTYTITQTMKNGYILLTPNSVTMSVNASTAAIDELSVVGTGSGQTRTLQFGSGNVQTVGFINAMMPTYRIQKVAADNAGKSVQGAQFILYKKNGTDYELVKTATGTIRTETTASNGYVSFAGLAEGEYLLVESSPATGYAAPAYVSHFKDGGNWKETVTGGNGAPSFSIAYSDYATTVNTITATGTIKNVRYATASIVTVATDSGAFLDGATYGLYSGDTLLGTASPTGGVYMTFKNTDGAVVDLAPGTYTIKQTGFDNNAHLQRSMDSEPLTFTVSENGAVNKPNASSAFYSYQNADAEVDLLNNALRISFANLPKPSTEALKMGETEVFDKDGHRVWAPLADVEFKVYYTVGEGEDAVKHYVMFNENNEMVGVATDKEAATTLVSRADGTFPVNYLDPTLSSTYTIEEITLPNIPGSDTPYARLETGAATINAILSEGKFSHYEIADPVINNRIDPHWVKITKYGLNVSEDNKLLSGRDPDGTPSGIPIETALEEGRNGEFEIYLKDSTDTWVLVDTVTTGENIFDEKSGGVSKQLGIGEYKIIETRNPIYTYPPGIGPAQGYIRDEKGVAEEDKGPIEDINGNWSEAEEDDQGRLVHYFIIDENSSSWIEIDLGNARVPPGDSPNYIRLFLEKTGYALDAEGNETYQGKLNGVKFEVYYGYIPKDGDSYVIASSAPLQTVSSGSLLRSPIEIDPGRFTTLYGELGAIKAAPGAGVEYDAVGFVLKEVGNVPEQYQNESGEGAEYFIPVSDDMLDHSETKFQTVGLIDENGEQMFDEDGKMLPIELKNYAGKGTLSVFKYGATASTVLTGAEFKLYRSATEDADPSTWQEVMDVNPGAQGAQGIELPTGYYFLKETVPGSGYNDAGTYETESVVTGAEGIVKTNTQGSFGPDSAIPVIIGGDANVTVKAFDQRHTTLSLRNYWSGSLRSDVDSTYTINGPGMDNVEFTITGAATHTFDKSLANGVYTITEKAVTGASGHEYSINGSASNPGITVTVAQGKVIALDIGGDPLPYGTGSGKSVWYNGMLDSTTDFSVITVDHTAKGSLLIKMGTIDAYGATSATFATGATTSFKIEKKAGEDWVPAVANNVVEGVATWSQTTNGTNGLKVLLDPGLYRVTQQSVEQQTATEPRYQMDTAPVFVLVGEDGVVSLVNNNLPNANGGFYGKASSESDPLDKANSATGYFYNKLNLGPLVIYKAGEGTTALLSGADFAVYSDEGATQEVETAFGMSPAGTYSTTLPPGNYWVKETRAPTGYAPRSELFPVTVVGNKRPTSASLIDYVDQANNINALGIKDARLASFTVAKTTTYPAIDGVVGASESKVAKLPVTLYKLNETTSEYEKIRIPDEATGENCTRISDNASEFGTLVFEGLGEGTYKVVESLPADGSLDYLTLNPIYARLESAFEITVAYNADTNHLDVTADDAPSGDWATDAQGKNTLTIHNDFVGVRIGAKKVDWDNETTAVAGARFELYDVDPRTNPETEPISSDSKTYATDATGMVYFDPMYVGLSGDTSKTYYVKETFVPTPYVIDEYYEGTVKEVTVTAEGSQAVAVFKNKKVPSVSSLSVAKSAAVADDRKPLRSEDLNATFTIQPKASQGNLLQLKNYTVTDAGFVFYGLNASNTEIQLTGANVPTYTINSVDVYGATSKKTPDSAATPVYASVDNGVTWQLLSGDPNVATTFALAEDAATFKIIYSDVVVDPQVETPILGADFKVGRIVFRVTFDSFEPTSAIVPEVTKIINIASVAATEGSTPLTKATAQAAVTVPVTERPAMSIEKTMNTTTLQRPGKSLEYSVVITNESPYESIFDPVIIDTLQSDAMYIKRDGTGEPIYTIVDDEGTELSGETFTTNVSGDMLMWALYGYELKPGKSIKVTFEAALASIIEGDVVSNTAYATSATPLSYSTKYPTGASFVGHPRSSEVTATNSHAATYAALGAMHVFEAGIYVKSNTTNTGIARSGSTEVQRAIKVNDGAWNASSTPSAVKPGDTIHYQLKVYNDGPMDGPWMENIRFAEILPNPDDVTFTSGARGSEWTQELFDMIAFNANIAVSESQSGASIASITYSNEASGNIDTLLGDTGVALPAQPTLADFKSFVVTFDPTVKVAPGEALAITYSITLPDLEDFSEAMLQENVLKIANTTFLPVFKYGSLVSKVQESSTVKAKLVLDPIEVSGYAFDDNNADGYFTEGTDAYKSGVTVMLQRSTDGGSTWSQHGSTTVTDQDGFYEFTGIESTYGYTGHQYRVVFTNGAPATETFSLDPGTATGFKNSHIASVSDDNVLGYTSGAALVADQEWNSGIKKREYTVTYRSGVDAGAINQANDIPAAEAVPYNSAYTVKGSSPVPTRLGYTFAGWKVTAGGAALDSTYAPGGTFRMPANNVELTAQWDLDNRISVAGYTGVYDARNHAISVDGPVSTDVVEYTVDGTTYTADTFTNVFKNVADSTRVDVKVTRDGVVIYDSADTTRDDDPAIVAITKATVYVSTGSGDFIYNNDWHYVNGSTYAEYGDGTGTLGGTVETSPTELVSQTATNVELAPGETVIMTVIGKQKDVNFDDPSVERNNTYTINWNDVDEENYSVLEDLGTIIVKEYAEQIVVNVTGGIWYYDGQAHGATVDPITLPEGYSLQGAPTSNATAKDVNGAGIQATCDSLTIINGAGTVVYKIENGTVTVNTLDVRVVPGTIQILPATVYVITEGGTKDYDGTALTKNGQGYTKHGNGTPGGTIDSAPFSLIAQSGKLVQLVPGENVTIKITGTQTEVGSSPNGYTVTWGAVNKDNYVFVDTLGTLTVTGHTDKVRVEVEEIEKTYDGTPLTPAVNVVNLPASLYTVEAAESTVSVTNVDEDNDGTADGEVAATVKTLVIKNKTGQIVAKIENGQIVAAETILDLEIVDGWAKINPVPVQIITGEELNRVYDGTTLTKGGTITVGSGSAQAFAYAPDTEPGTEVTLVNGERATIKTTGSITEPGEVVNNYSLTWDGTSGAKKSNYQITHTIGKLSIIDSQTEIVFDISGGEWVYDGQTHQATVTKPDLPTGYSYVVEPKTNASIKNAYDGTAGNGTVQATLDELSIVNAVGQVVAKVENGTLTTSLNIKVNNGTLKVTPATVHVTTDSDTFTYDPAKEWTAGGSAYTVYGNDALQSGPHDFPYDPGMSIDLVPGETATFKTTGKQKDVNFGQGVTGNNTYEIAWDSADARNYTIVEDLGTLIVTETGEQIVVTLTGGQWVYDGQAHGATVDTITLPAGYEVVGTPSSSTTVTNVAEGEIAATCDSLEIKNAASGQTVYKLENGIVDPSSTLSVEIVPTAIQVIPAHIAVETASAEKDYDATPLTADGGITVTTGDGSAVSGTNPGMKAPVNTVLASQTQKTITLISGEDILVTITGSQTTPGSSENAYEIDWNGNEASNYTVTDITGTLLVKEHVGKVKVVIGTVEKEYDGTPLSAPIEVQGLPAGGIYTVETLASNATATHVAQGTMSAICDELVIKNSSGQVVARVENGQIITADTKLDLELTTGSVKINPVPIYVETGSMIDQTYTGTALTAGGTATLTANGVPGTAQPFGYTPGNAVNLVNNETATFATTGILYEPGSVVNGYTVAFNGDAQATDYAITDMKGTLSIVEDQTEIVFTVTGGSWVYDGQAHSGTVSKPALPTGYTYSVEPATTISVTNVSEGSVPAYLGDVEIKNAQGTVVYQVQNGVLKVQKLNVRVVHGTLEIKPAQVFVTTGSKEFLYDGSTFWTENGSVYTQYGQDAQGNPYTTLSKTITPEGVIVSLVPGEEVRFTVTGKQKDVNFDDPSAVGNNTYTVERGTTDLSNYEFVDHLGTLIVKDNEDQVVVFVQGNTWEYDGQAHGATILPITLPSGYALDGEPVTNARVTDVDDGAVTATVDALKINRNDGTTAYQIENGVVTAEDLDVMVVDGTIKITPVPVLVTTYGETFIYDGETKTKDGEVVVTAQGEAGPAQPIAYTPGSNVTLVNGETATFSTTGTVVQPNEGTIQNAWTVAFPSHVKASNYAITEQIGTLNVIDSQEAIVIDVIGDTWVYDTQGHGATLSYPTLPTGYAYDAIETTDTVTNVNDGEKQATTDILKIVNKQGTVVAEVESANADGSLNWRTKSLNISVNPGVIKVIPASIYVHTDSGIFIYDGTTEHTAPGEVYTVYGGTIGGGSTTTSPVALDAYTPDTQDIALAPGETVKFTITGKQKDVNFGMGVQDNNTYTIDWGTVDKDNYLEVKDLGELIVKDNDDQIAIIIEGGTWEYDGQAHGATIRPVTLPEGYQFLAEPQTLATVTDVDEGTKTAIVDAMAITDLSGRVVYEIVNGNVTVNNMQVEIFDDTIKVTAVPIHVTTYGETFTYDGETKTKGGEAVVTEQGNTQVAQGFDFAPGTTVNLVNGETAVFATTSSMVQPGGPIDNAYTIDWGTVKASNYHITDTVGKLAVIDNQEKIVLEVEGGTWVYDALVHGGILKLPVLPKGYAFKAVDTTARVKNVSDGTVRATVDVLEIIDAQGRTVAKIETGILTTSLDIEIISGDLSVTPQTITVTTESASKVYDGTPLTAGGSYVGIQGDEQISFTITGSQTEVGSSENTFAIDWSKSTALKSNYIVNAVSGMLTVTESADEIVVTTVGGTFVYDGTERRGEVSYANLPTGYTVDVAQSNTRQTDVTDGKIDVKCDTLIIRNAQGVDVTDQLNIRYVNGTLSITPAPLLVTTDSASRTYNGAALSAGGRVSGLMNNETVDFYTTGSQTEVGSSPNTYVLNWVGSAKKSNYTVIDRLGTLTVSAVPAGGGDGGGGGTTIVIPGGGGTTVVYSPPSDTGTTPESPIDAIITPLANALESGVGGMAPQQDEATIGEDGTPLYGGDPTWCWMHWYILLGMAITAIYSAIVIFHRRRFTKKLREYEDEAMGTEKDERQTRYGGQGIGDPVAQGTGV